MPPISIYCDKISTQARKIFTQSGFEVKSEQAASEILWIRKNFKKQLPQVNEKQLINHLPDESAMTTKGKLTENLKALDQITAASQQSFSSKNFYQESYLLYDEKERELFFQQTENRDQDLWILKPTGLSKGRGVKIIDDLAVLKEVMLNQDNPGYAQRLTDYFYYKGKKQDFIIQKHIDAPLLLNKKKSEIRVYWLVLSLEPLSAIMYTEPIVRLSSENYVEGDYANPLRHITNVYQQKKYNKQFDGRDLKWTMDMCKEEALRLGLTDNEYFVEDELIPKIRKALTYVLRSAKQNMLSSSLYNSHAQLSSFNYFGLYGCDIMLDRNLDPWVLEVQKGPGLSFSHEHKAKVLLPMLKHGIESVYKYKFEDDAKVELPGKFTWLIHKGLDCEGS